jgi:hypothetical protein
MPWQIGYGVIGVKGCPELGADCEGEEDSSFMVHLMLKDEFSSWLGTTFVARVPAQGATVPNFKSTQYLAKSFNPPSSPANFSLEAPFRYRALGNVWPEQFQVQEAGAGLMAPRRQSCIAQVSSRLQ